MTRELVKADASALIVSQIEAVKREAIDKVHTIIRKRIDQEDSTLLQDYVTCNNGTKIYVEEIHRDLKTGTITSSNIFIAGEADGAREFFAGRGLQEIFEKEPEKI